MGLLSKLCRGGLGLALAWGGSVALAAITQLPALPAEVRITPLPGLSGPDGFVFQALGSARMDGASWVADVVATEPGRFMLDPQAGLQAIWQGRTDRPQTFTWERFTVPLSPSPDAALPDLVFLRADKYADGVLKGEQLVMAYTDGAVFPPDALPEGQTLVWVAGPGFLERVAYEAGNNGGAYVDPVAFALVEVRGVPEPATWALMGLGLVGVFSPVGCGARGRTTQPQA